MNKKIVLSAVFFTLFLDFFNLGLIYPLFSSLIFEGQGELIATNASNFEKNIVFALLISTFPFGQFLGAPLIGQLSDHYGRRKLMIISLLGTVCTLGVCALGIYFSSMATLLMGRLIGGVMAGNMTLAYASLADFSTPEDKVKNFALIPLATGLGFTLGPYLAGILANPETHSLAGPTLPFLVATILSCVNLLLVLYGFPETREVRKDKEIKIKVFSSFFNIKRALQDQSLRNYLMIFYFMISSNFVFVQFVGPFAIENFSIKVTEVGYLYANIGIAVALGHLFLTRKLANRCSSKIALFWSLLALTVLLVAIVLSSNLYVMHVVTFLVMLACAVAYTNSMALVSDQAGQEQQGEVMGVAVSLQCCAEFLPALLLGLVAFMSQAIPLLVASLFAVGSCFLLQKLAGRTQPTTSMQQLEISKSS